MAKNVRLPRTVCAVVASVLSGSHSTLNRLFINSGAPGISSTGVGDLKAQLGAIKVEACLEIVYDKKRRNGV